VGKRIIQVDPALLQSLLTHGSIFPGHAVQVEEGVPAGAQFLRSWYHAEEGREGCIVLLFEHPDWTDIYPFPILTVRLRSFTAPIFTVSELMERNHVG
jgi:hypothetical protein